VLFRANRAQYAEVSFQTVTDDDITDVLLPSMQGVAEDEGMFILSLRDMPIG
jgi:U3 small nucleolar RNA-associated protein 21